MVAFKLQQQDQVYQAVQVVQAAVDQEQAVMGEDQDQEEHLTKQIQQVD
jgi:hypothetical protein